MLSLARLWRGGDASAASASQAGNAATRLRDAGTTPLADLDVFVCANAADREARDQLVGLLRNRGYAVACPEDGDTSEDGLLDILAAIQNARYVICLWSAAGAEDDRLRAEARAASYRAKLIGVRLEGQEWPAQIRAAGVVTGQQILESPSSLADMLGPPAAEREPEPARVGKRGRRPARRSRSRPRGGKLARTDKSGRARRRETSPTEPWGWRMWLTVVVLALVAVALLGMWERMG